MSIDKRGNELIIDHDAIPGFMGAMTMPYAVSDNSMLDKAAPGDEINADLKVQGDHVAIDRIDIVRKAGSAPAPITHIHFPQNGREGAEFCAHESKRQAHSDEA